MDAFSPALYIVIILTLHMNRTLTSGQSGKGDQDQESFGMSNKDESRKAGEYRAYKN